jgi:hypothetical protein
LRRSK